jgi:hypothetical protein
VTEALPGFGTGRERGGEAEQAVDFTGDGRAGVDAAEEFADAVGVGAVAGEGELGEGGGLFLDERRRMR